MLPHNAGTGEPSVGRMSRRAADMSYCSYEMLVGNWSRRGSGSRGDGWGTLRRPAGFKLD